MIDLLIFTDDIPRNKSIVIGRTTTYWIAFAAIEYRIVTYTRP